MVLTIQYKVELTHDMSTYSSVVIQSFRSSNALTFDTRQLAGNSKATRGSQLARQAWVETHELSRLHAGFGASLVSGEYDKPVLASESCILLCSRYTGFLVHLCILHFECLPEF